MNLKALIKNWKFWLLIALVLTGCIIDLERAKGYGIFGLKIGVGLGLLIFAAQFFTDKEKYEKTVWKDNSGRVVSETGWKWRGFSSPAERGSMTLTPSGCGCVFFFLLLSPFLGLLTASLVNISSLLFNVPPRNSYSDPVIASLALKSPLEANRVFHPLGFSIIIPTGWEVEIYDSALVVSAPSTRYNCLFRVTCHSGGYSAIYDTVNLIALFQQYPAKVSWDTGKAIDDSRDIVPFRNKPIPVINDYFASFKYEDKKAPK
jgi:hypothetical protein